MLFLGSLDDAIIGKLEKQGETFELFLDPTKTYDYLEGKKHDLNNILVVEEIFKDARKGERQSLAVVEKVFKTKDIYKVLEIILKEGQIQLTTHQRKKMIEDKKKKIMDIILKNAIDVRTKAPIPPKRLELAMEENRIMIDPFKKVEEQVNDVISKLKYTLPIKFEQTKIAFKIPVEFGNKCYNYLKSYHIEKEQWTNTHLFIVVSIPAGLKGEVLSKLGKLTSGNIQSKLLE